MTWKGNSISDPSPRYLLNSLHQVTQNKGMTPHKVSNHQFRPTHVKNMLLTAEITSLNCDETICPSIYVSNQMHHMLFQCIIDLWGLLLFSRTLPRITGWNEVSKDQFRPMPAVDSVERPSPDERKSRCNYNKAVALKQQLPEPQSSKRKLSGLVPRSFLFIQDPKQRHDTAQSLQPPVQTHPCKENAPHS